MPATALASTTSKPTKHELVRRLRNLQDERKDEWTNRSLLVSTLPDGHRSLAVERAIKHAYKQGLVDSMLYRALVTAP